MATNKTCVVLGVQHPREERASPSQEFQQVRMASDSLGSDPMAAPEPITVARDTEPAHGPPDGDEVGIEDGVGLLEPHRSRRNAGQFTKKRKSK